MEQQELSRAERKALKAKRQRKRQIIRRIKVGAGLCFVLAVLLFLLFSFVLFKVENIKVIPFSTEDASSGNYYNDDEIIRVSGVDIGDSLVLISKKQISETIETLLPYIGEVTVKRSYPSTLKLIIEDTSAFFAVESDTNYTLLDRNYKVLGYSDYIPENCAKLVGVKFENLTVGNIAEFEDSANMDRLNNLISECENAQIGNITKYDLTNIANVKIVINSRITLIIGTITDLSDKLGLGIKTIDVETENNVNAHIIIDVTDPDRSYVRDDNSPIEEYSNEVTSESETTNGTDDVAETTTSNDNQDSGNNNVAAVG